MRAIRDRLAVIAAVFALALAGTAAACGDDDNQGAVEDVGQAAEEAGQDVEKEAGEPAQDADAELEGDK